MDSSSSSEARHRRPPEMDVRGAIVAGIVLAIGSGAMLRYAGAAGVAAIAGAIGLVIATALIGLTVLAWSWMSARERRYVTANSDVSGSSTPLPGEIGIDDDPSVAAG